MNLTRLQRAVTRHGDAEIETLHQSGRPEYHIRIRQGPRHATQWIFPLTRARIFLLLVMISVACSALIPQWEWLFRTLMQIGSLWSTSMV